MNQNVKKAGSPLVIAAAIAAVVFGTACESPRASYVDADRATFDAIAPNYRIYVQADTSLTASDVQSELDLVRTWEKRIEAEEALLEEKRND
ncbi:MAG: hypothetical protein AAF196_08925 [Planctomycetota bacterium]